MIELYVLNGDLEQIGVIDAYTSLIWANRYNENGDCELYIEANDYSMTLLQKNYFLARNDDDMVCRIEKIELNTDVEAGNYLIISGFDIKNILRQRIIFDQTNVDGNVENYIRDLVYNNLINPSFSARQIRNESGRPNFYLGDKQNFNEVITEQVTYKSVEEKVQELCKKYQWGYKIITDMGNLYFELYNGVDRSDTVIFSPQYENLISTTYVEDSTNSANVALIGGEGEGSERAKNISGYAESLDRYEIFVDAKDVSRKIKWSDLIAIYPTTDQGGQGYINSTENGNAVYCMNYIDITIVDDNQLSELIRTYPDGTEIIQDGIKYYRVYNAIIADLSSLEPKSSDDVVLRDLIYSVYLLNRGYEKLSEYGTTVTFDGTVEPNTTFVYKKDYFLGDKVSVENEFGITAKARIVEVIEVVDENGYSVEPKFEYVEVSNQTPTITSGYLLAENGSSIVTEDNKYIIREEAIIPTVSSQSDQFSAGENVKISQLPEVESIQDENCMPIVSGGITSKLTYEKLKSKLEVDLPRGEDGKTPQMMINSEGHLIAIYE